MKWPQMCRLNMDEWPMLIVSLHGKSIPVREADTGKTVWFGGRANQLSKETIAHPLIDSHSPRHETKQQREQWHLHRRGGPNWLRRDQAAFSGFIDSQLWRGGPHATLGARLPGWKAIDVIGAALGHPRRHSPAIVG